MKRDMLANKVRHFPVERGRCTECHSPHGSKIKKQLLNQPNELCLSCHERIITTKARKGHLYLEEGDCLSCHFPHFSDQKKLLSRKDPKLCLSCHTSDTAQIRQTHRSSLKKIQKCLSCHEPHVTENPGLLKHVMHEPFVSGDCEACHK
jgi:predicted CXXCH cytochrome family protein